MVTTCSSSSLLALTSLLLFTSMISSINAQILPWAVRDTAGNEVQPGVKYYVLPVLRGRGGGLTLGPSRNNTKCPSDVVQSPSELSNGLPIVFSPVRSEPIVRLSTDTNIKFDASTTCVQSTVWKRASFDESVRKYFITTGGVEGNPGGATLSNWFKIERDGSNYKLSSCPTVCLTCGKILCRDIGVYQDKGGVRRLALTDDSPFVVQFKKA